VTHDNDFLIASLLQSAYFHVPLLTLLSLFFLHELRKLLVPFPHLTLALLALVDLLNWLDTPL
jgi:Ca2+/H+ antiporter